MSSPAQMVGTDLAVIDTRLASKSLDELGEIFQREYRLAAERGLEMVEHLIASGEVLLTIRLRLEHGEWEDWLERNYPQTERHAQKLMRLARHAHIVRPAKPRTLGSALALVAEPKDRELLEVNRAEAKRLRKDGLTWEEIGERLGVSRRTAYYYANPDAYVKHLKRIAKRRRQTMKLGKRELLHLERDAVMKSAGGELAEAYSLVRRALQTLQESSPSDPEAKRAVKTAMSALYNAEDGIVRAGKLTPTLDQNRRMA